MRLQPTLSLIHFSFYLIIYFFISVAIPSQSLALPDEEVQALARSSAIFKAAEDRIQRVWSELPKDIKSRVRADQIEWIKTLRDQEASQLISQGKSKAEAYAEVTNKKSDYLETLVNSGQTTLYKDDTLDHNMQKLVNFSAIVTFINEKRYDEVIDGLKELGIAGYGPAQYELHLFYRYGRGSTPIDESEAVKWLRLSADNGEAKAQYMLGHCYDNYGDFPEYFNADRSKALFWYLKAAEQGHVESMYQTGKLYLLDFGFEATNYSEQQKYFSEAYNWLLKAAHEDNGFACFLLGRIYAEGFGVDINKSEALYWFNLAKDNGVWKASDAIKKLSAQ
jgi:TPR repeat protein